MIKTFEYRGFTISVEVKLFDRAEKRMDGDSWHKVIIKDTDPEGEYYKEGEILTTKDLKSSLDTLLIEIRNDIDIRKDGEELTKEQEILVSLGFE